MTKKSFSNIKNLLQIPTTIGEKFIYQTKIVSKEPEPPTDTWPEEWKKIYYKGYDRLREIPLPKPYKNLNKSLSHVLTMRQSRRTFSPIPLTKKELSTLLFYSAGIKDKKTQKRFYPSAGARYPLEIYLLSLNTKLPTGLYHYYIKNHSLELLQPTNNIDLSKYYNQEWIRNASCVIFITAVFKRNTIKYSERGFRYILTESGHLSQNLYLIAESLGLACCANESFIDDKVNSFIDINGITEGIIYSVACGKKP